ncbi:MAG: outer membrane beta-barrel protein [Longimicrobiales bacterium]
MFSGPELARQIQEGVVGYYVGDHIWIDVGLYFSHIGTEGWISRGNWTYTRSLIADWLPYDESVSRRPGRPRGSSRVCSLW